MMIYSILLLPIVMILCGILMYKCAMTRNHMVGYRTLITLKNDKIWKYANKLMGKIWLIIGLLLLLISASIILLFNSSRNIILIFSVCIGIEIIIMIIPIIFVEIHLNRKFK